MSSKTEESVDPQDSTGAVDTSDQRTEEKSEEKPAPTANPEKSAITAKDRALMIGTIVKVYLFLFCIFLGLVSLYYGSYYKRQDKFRSFNFLVVNLDTSFEVNGTTIPGLVGEQFLTIFQNDTVEKASTLELWGASEIADALENFDQNITSAVHHSLRHNKYWQAFIIAPNTTRLIYESLATANVSNLPKIKKSIALLYEQGRHFSVFTQYIFKTNFIIEQIWSTRLVSNKVYAPIIENYLSDSQRSKLMANNETMQLLTVHPPVNEVSISTFQDAAVLGPSQLGLVYGQLFSFYQLQFSMTIYKYIDSRLKFKHYMVYRIIASQVNSLVLSLVYCLITLAFRVNIWSTFGRSSFLVLWSIIFLFFSANNAVNENVLGIINAYDKMPFIGPFIVFYIIINIATTFYPFSMMAGFYRIGNGLIMNNCFNAIKPIFFNTTKQYMGRNIGILVVWTVVFNTSLIFVTKFSMRKSRQMARAEAQKEAQQRQSVTGQPTTTNEDEVDEIYDEKNNQTANTPFIEGNAKGAEALQQK